MSAKLVLTVKDSSRMAKDYSMSMMDKMFHPLKHNKILNSKAKIGILIDDEEEGTLYEASKTPYEINLQPGFHRITLGTAVTVRVQKMPADSHLAEEDIMIG